jgi:hypothetical protein
MFFNMLGLFLGEERGVGAVEMGKVGSKIYHARFSKKKIFANNSKTHCFHPPICPLFRFPLRSIKKNL